jgi:hypothetical protein
MLLPKIVLLYGFFISNSTKQFVKKDDHVKETIESTQYQLFFHGPNGEYLFPINKKENQYVGE